MPSRRSTGRSKLWQVSRDRSTGRLRARLDQGTEGSTPRGGSVRAGRDNSRSCSGASVPWIVADSAERASGLWVFNEKDAPIVQWVGRRQLLGFPTESLSMTTEQIAPAINLWAVAQRQFDLAAERLNFSPGLRQVSPSSWSQTDATSIRGLYP